MLNLTEIQFLQNESAATAIVYSGDMEALAIGHQNGKIHLWKGTECEEGVTRLYACNHGRFCCLLA